MVINIVDHVSVPVLETENHAPVPRHLDGPVPFEAAFQGMQIRPGVIHIAYDGRGIQTIQNVLKLLSMLGLDALLRSIVEQLLQPLMPEAFDHLSSVTHKVTIVKCQEAVLTPAGRSSRC
jgi:hypothetical protein